MSLDLLYFNDSGYPFLLKEIPDPPQKLYCRGELPEAGTPCLALVGTRKASPAGLKLAESMAAELVSAGIVIVSGLAMGIDTAAHEGALKGGGRTVAVLGNGLNKIYPAQNEKLAEVIIKMGGAVISEYEPDEESFPNHFIERNRIISGLSLGVIVVEAPVYSGALTTARFAAEQGRDVWVVPGPITHPNYVGSHALIRDGATLITKVSEVLEDLGLDSVIEKLNLNLESGSAEEKIVKVITEAETGLNIDRITELTKLEPQALNEALVGLILAGTIEEKGGRYFI
ncbi:MAG: DNA-protecting protein DprA [Candidatus Colwellbacteria bacterium]|nr:DNA-protecting protein DprA [Candidatus Colwellbacteria bacterium]